MSSATDDVGDLDLQMVERNAVSTGTAGYSADGTTRLKGSPWLLRYAPLVSDNANVGGPS
jgi:hypothetical protein